MTEAQKLQHETSLKKVLVLDDDQMTLSLVKMALKEKYEVVALSQAAEAYNVALDTSPDLLILDLNMPNIDGFEILDQFKSHPILSSIPIICLSGEKSYEARKQAREMGASGFMTKPVNKGRLIADIALMIEASNTMIQSEDQKIHCFLGANNSEKDSAIKSKIRDWSGENQKLLIVSLTNGENFCSQKEYELIEKGQLFYFQIKGNIIAKLPFIEDLTPIIYDLEKLLGEPTKNFHLIFEDPDLILRGSEQNTLGHVIMFSELLRKSFPKIGYYLKKPTSRQASDQVNQLANLLVGRY